MPNGASHWSVLGPRSSTALPFKRATAVWRWNRERPGQEPLAALRSRTGKGRKVSAPSQLASCVPVLIGPRRGLGPLLIGQLQGPCAEGFWS